MDLSITWLDNAPGVPTYGQRKMQFDSPPCGAKEISFSITDCWIEGQARKSSEPARPTEAWPDRKLGGLQFPIVLVQWNYDLSMGPTLAKPPVRLGPLNMLQDVQSGRKQVLKFGPYPALYNVTGQPSMSVPLNSRRALGQA